MNTPPSLNPGQPVDPEAKQPENKLPPLSPPVGPDELERVTFEETDPVEFKDEQTAGN